MIGGCIVNGKYNMTAEWYEKDYAQHSKSGQVKNTYSGPTKISLIARGLANLRGKDSGTYVQYGNKLDEYHYVRIKSTQKLSEGDVVTRIKDSNGMYYMDDKFQLVVLGVTPTFDPFGAFVEYDIIADKPEVAIKLPANTMIISSGDGDTIVMGEANV